MENLTRNYVEVTFLKYNYGMRTRLTKDQYLELGSQAYLYDATGLSIGKNNLVVVETVYGLGVGVVKNVGVTEHPQITAGFEIKQVCGIISTYAPHNKNAVQSLVRDLEVKFDDAGQKYLKNKNFQILVDAGYISLEDVELYKVLQSQLKEV